MLIVTDRLLRASLISQPREVAAKDPELIQDVPLGTTFMENAFHLLRGTLVAQEHIGKEVPSIWKTLVDVNLRKLVVAKDQSPTTGLLGMTITREDPLSLLRKELDAREEPGFRQPNITHHLKDANGEKSDVAKDLKLIPELLPMNTCMVR